MVTCKRTVGLNQSLRGAEVSLQAATLFGHGGKFVAHSQIDSEMRLDAPVILEKHGVTRIAKVPHQVADKDRRTAAAGVVQRGVGYAREEVLDRAECDSAAPI